MSLKNLQVNNDSILNISSVTLEDFRSSLIGPALHIIQLVNVKQGQ